MILFIIIVLVYIEQLEAAFKIQISGEPMAAKWPSCGEFDLNILAGGSNHCPNAFFLPMLLSESNWKLKNIMIV